MINSENFGQWPWKNPHGENQSKREILLFLQDKKSDIHFYSKKSNLSQPRNLTSRLSWFPCFCCLDFCANLLGKCAKNIRKNLPSKTVPALSESVLYGQHLMLLYDLIFCAKKNRMLPRKKCLLFTSKTVQKSTVRTDLDFCAVRPVYSLEIRAGYGL